VKTLQFLKVKEIYSVFKSKRYLIFEISLFEHYYTAEMSKLPNKSPTPPTQRSRAIGLYLRNLPLPYVATVSDVVIVSQTVQGYIGDPPKMGL